MIIVDGDRVVGVTSIIVVIDRVAGMGQRAGGGAAPADSQVPQGIKLDPVVRPCLG